VWLQAKQSRRRGRLDEREGADEWASSVSDQKEKRESWAAARQMGVDGEIPST
jgi:predicted kinase